VKEVAKYGKQGNLQGCSPRYRAIETIAVMLYQLTAPPYPEIRRHPPDKFAGYSSQVANFFVKGKLTPEEDLIVDTTERQFRVLLSIAPGTQTNLRQRLI
jgi:hypothetical protein